MTLKGDRFLAWLGKLTEVQVVAEKRLLDLGDELPFRADSTRAHGHEENRAQEDDREQPKDSEED